MMGGLLLLEGSNKVFGKYLNSHPLKGFTAHYKVDINDINMSNCNPIKICAPPGHIFLWDSRMTHCNVHLCMKLIECVLQCVYDS